jgi:hypothetical protein
VLYTGFSRLREFGIYGIGLFLLLNQDSQDLRINRVNRVKALQNAGLIELLDDSV